jgi:hypothetical protein
MKLQMKKRGKDIRNSMQTEIDEMNEKIGPPVGDTNIAYASQI